MWWAAFLVPIGLVSQFTKDIHFTDRFVLLRQEDGTYHAFHDCCPHRGASFSVANKPLQRVGAHLVCPYHGWQFNRSDGMLEEGPGVAKGACGLFQVKTQIYDGVMFYEDSGEFHFHHESLEDSGTHRVVRGHTFIKCDLQRVVANIIDPQHISSVHAFGDAGSMPSDYEIDVREIHYAQCHFDYKSASRGFSSSVAGDRLVRVINAFDGPYCAMSTVYMPNGWNKTVLVHAREEDNGTRLFWCLKRNFLLGAHFDFIVREAMTQTLAEDQRILESLRKGGGRFHSRFDALQLLYIQRYT